MPGPAHPSPRKRRLVRAGASAAGLLVVYTAFGFLVAPSLVRRALVKEGSAALRRDVSVAKVRLNPLALSVTIEGLEVRHRDGAPFVGFESLYVRLAPLRFLSGDVGLAEIRLVRPSVHVGLDAAGALTFQDLLAQEGPPAAPASPAPPEDGGWGVSIGRLAVEEASVVFRDATRKPAFETALGPLTIRLESFHTEGGRDSPYSFAGTTDSDETFRWTGTVRTQPFRSAGTLAFERITLPKYAPYTRDELPADLLEGLLDLEIGYELEWGAERRTVRSGKFLGYGIQKGKLDLDLRYTVLDRALTATNVVKVNQLTLGEATDSPDATKIPVRLALALLQDADGVILLDVPVEGRIDDPEFKLGKVIWRTVLNILVKVATSPFRALAALAGGGEADISMVEFEPGTAEPLPAAQERFAMLAKSLAQRPALGLELEGSADAERDGPALRRAALERSLRRAKAAAGAKATAASEGEPRVAPDERLRLVRAAYESAFPAPAAPAAPRKEGQAAPAPPTPQEMEERLAATMEVPPETYRALAAERAQRAREALMAAGLDQARLFPEAGGAGRREPGRREGREGHRRRREVAGAGRPGGAAPGGASGRHDPRAPPSTRCGVRAPSPHVPSPGRRAWTRPSASS